MQERLSSVQGKKECIFILSIILIILIPHVFVIFAHENIVLNRFTTDDSFYYFKTAQNIIEGQGISFDGIAPTNGLHPLWMVLLVPIFFFANYDLVLPLRLVIVLQVILGTSSSLVLFKLICSRCSCWTGFVVALFWAFSPYTYGLIFKGGTEAGLNAFLLVLLWWQSYQVSEMVSQGKASVLNVFLLGCLATLTLLARLDNVYLVFVLGGWLILRFWRKPGKELENVKDTVQWWIKIGVAYFTPVITSLGLYLLFNQMYVGSAMPVSGKVKRWWGTLNYSVYGKPPEGIREIISEIFSSNNSIGPWAMVISPLNSLQEWYRSIGNSNQLLWGAVLIALSCLIGFLIIKNYKFIFGTFWGWNLVPLLIGCVLQILYYKTSGHVAQKEWYWLVESFFIVLITAIVLEAIARSLSIHPVGEKFYIAVSVIAVLVIIFPFLKIPNYVIHYVPDDEEHFYLKRAKWLKENTETNSMIGMTGSGIIWLFCSRSSTR